MSWHDSARSLEPNADAALREELRALLGVGPRSYFETEATPELCALADDLRREARRRNHTARKQTSWMLLAAALPFALVLGGVGAWGVTQKHKADAFAAAVQAKDSEIQRLAAAVLAQPAPGPTLAAAPAATQLASRNVAPKAKVKGKELVIPVDRSPEPVANDTLRVKGQ